MEILLTVLIGIVTSVIGGTCLFLVQRYFTKMHQREENRDRIKAKEYGLILQSLDALGKLTVANSIALRDGKTNGEMSVALSTYEEVEKEMHQHLIHVYTEESL